MTKTHRQIQEAYYSGTAARYDHLHSGEQLDEHDFALGFLSSCLQTFDAASVLDVGSGTGRAVKFISETHPDIRVNGIEPVRALREQAYMKGIPQDCIVEGYGEKIPFPDQSFDFVCEFGILHHVPRPDLVVDEMLRVSRKGIFISDSNNFGQGGIIGRSAKQALDFLGLWRLFDYFRTRGKMYQISEGDGLYYSYSVFNNYRQIKKSCKSVHILNTMNAGINPYRTSGHIALLGLK